MRHCSANMCVSVRCAGCSQLLFTPYIHTTIHSTGGVGDQNGQQQREPDVGQCVARMCAWRGSTGSSHPLTIHTFFSHHHSQRCRGARNGQPQREPDWGNAVQTCVCVCGLRVLHIKFTPPVHTPSFHTTIHSTVCIGDQNGQQQREPDEGQCGARMCAWWGGTGSSHPLAIHTFCSHLYSLSRLRPERAATERARWEALQCKHVCECAVCGFVIHYVHTFFSHHHSQHWLCRRPKRAATERAR